MKFKRIIPAFLLLAVYLFSATTTRELFKLPLLVEHYYDHQYQNKGISLTAFLLEHYYTEDGSDADADEDNRLPFKSADNAGPASFVSLLPPALLLLTSGDYDHTDRHFRVYNDLLLPSQYLDRIWQPPRSC